MAVVSRIARITLSDNLGNSREWLATAAVQDTAAGAAVNITVTQTTTGGAPPGTANNIREMQVLNESGGVIATYTWAEGAASTNFTHYMTSNGLVGGTPLADTFEILLRVQKTNGGPTATYNVESDGSPNVPPTLFTSSLDRGWIRSTTTATITASNISLGGAKNEPAQFADSLFVRTVLGAGSSIARSLTAQFTGSSKTKASSSTTSATKDVTFSGAGITDGRVNEGFPASDTTYTVTVATPSNSAFTGQPWTVLTRTDDTLRVDPRLTATHLFQLDDNGFSTPPYAGQALSNERPSTSIAYLATHIRAARGVITGSSISEGVNGISIDETLTAQSNGDTVTRSDTTVTNNGEDGWCPDFLQWTSPLPGGDWVKSVEITAPADINASGYLVNTSATYVLIASRSPFDKVKAGGGNAGTPGRHFSPGDPLTIFAGMWNTKDDANGRQYIEADADSQPVALFTRPTPFGTVEYLDASYNWVADPADGTPIYAHNLSQSPGDSRLWLLTIPGASTANWGTTDCDVEVNGFKLLGVAYDADFQLTITGSSYHHDLDLSEHVGIVVSNVDPSTGQPQQSHTHADRDLQFYISPRTSAGIDPNAASRSIALALRRAGDNGAEDWDGTVWWQTTDPSHPNGGELIFNAVSQLPSGVGFSTLPAAQVADTINVNSPWILAFASVLYDEGLASERTKYRDLVIPVFKSLNRHDKYELDPIAFALNGVVSYK